MVTICAVGINSDYSLFGGASSVRNDDMNCVFDYEMDATGKKKAKAGFAPPSALLAQNPKHVAQIAGLKEDFVKDIVAFEGYRKFPYDDHGQWAVGFGHKLKSESERAYYQKHGCSKELAYHYLSSDLKLAKKEVQRLLGDYSVEKDKKAQDIAFTKNKGKKLVLTQHQEEALVDLVFNLGAGQVSPDTKLVKFLQEAKSSDKSVRDKKFMQAAWQLDFLAINGGKTAVAGLAKRRVYDVLLFCNGWHSDKTIKIMKDFKERGLDDPKLKDESYFERACDKMIKLAENSQKNGQPAKLNFVKDFR